MNQTEMAHLVGVSPMTVSNWVREGMPCRHPGGRGRASDIDLATALEWLAKRGIRPNVARDHALVIPTDQAPDDDDSAGEDGADYKVSRAKREHYAAAREEMRYRQEAGELMVAGEVETAVADACTTIRTALEALPDALALRLAAASDENECRNLLADEIERMLEQLSADLLHATKA
ncbi:MAG TPA: terminase small subunit [Rhodocyclaceae bacterium]|nr:terminase small subunit [Rhodocyclaceae bacterium]